MNDLNYLFDHLDDLKEFKNDTKTALITDIDGTISEIVPTPGEAVVSEDMKQIIEKIAKKYKFTGVMTGRSINNALDMIGNKNLIYIGNHGMEQLKNGKIWIDPEVKKYVPHIKKLAKSLKKDLKDHECILFQDKELSFTVHYRLCDNGDKIRKKALDTIASIKDSKNLKISEGRKVIEIRPPAGHNKGSILQKFIFENKIKKMIYLGDDITDVDAFRKLNELSSEKKVETLSIAVNSNETPDYVKESADFYVKSVDEVQIFLKWFSER
ncbi:MAG TPA: trehalose-phosphatase [Methanobacterium sp.]|nr:trehalose-phosphatase [Methanobacterium sp.]